jgi:hypothetical protein
MRLRAYARTRARSTAAQCALKQQQQQLLQ